MKKGLLIGLVVVVIAIGAGVYFLLSGLDELVRTAVEKAGSEVTQVDVTLNKVKIEVTDGKAAMGGLQVGNPAGFKTDYAFQLGEISVALDTATVTSDTIVIKEIVVGEPKVTYELGPQGSNIDVIKNNVASHGGGGGSSGGGESSEGPKVVIENLYIRGGEVNVSAVALGGKAMTAKLPEIHLKDIGKDEGGAGPAEVAEKVMAALTSRVGNVVGNLDLSGILEGVPNLPDNLKGLAGDAAGKAGEAMKGVTEGAGGATEGVTKGAGDAVKKLFSD